MRTLCASIALGIGKALPGAFMAAAALEVKTLQELPPEAPCSNTEPRVLPKRPLRHPYMGSAGFPL